MIVIIVSFWVPNVHLKVVFTDSIQARVIELKTGRISELTVHGAIKTRLKTTDIYDKYANTNVRG